MYPSPRCAEGAGHPESTHGDTEAGTRHRACVRSLHDTACPGFTLPQHSSRF